MRRLVIFGGEGIGMIAASVAEALGSYRVEGFLNDVKEPGAMVGKFRRYPVLGGADRYEDYLTQEDVDFFVAYGGMKRERSVYEKFKSFSIPRNRYATLIHPTAVAPREFCKIGTGVMMAPLAQLSPDTVIGDNSIILGNAFVSHDTEVEEFVNIATNGVIGSHVRIGAGTHVGSNATVRENVKIGRFCLIGIGSVVLADVEEESIVAGSPARVLRRGGGERP